MNQITFITKSDNSKLVDDIRQMKGVIKVTQTFPDNSDEELRRIYVMNVEHEMSDAICKLLREHPGIEEADIVAARRIM